MSILDVDLGDGLHRSAYFLKREVFQMALAEGLVPVVEGWLGARHGRMLYD